MYNPAQAFAKQTSRIVSYYFLKKTGKLLSAFLLEFFVNDRHQINSAAGLVMPEYSALFNPNYCITSSSMSQPIGAPGGISLCMVGFASAGAAILSSASKRCEV